MVNASRAICLNQQEEWEMVKQARACEGACVCGCVCSGLSTMLHSDLHTSGTLVMIQICVVVSPV